jgi:flagellar hook assembly protein FlgD
MCKLSTSAELRHRSEASADEEEVTFDITEADGTTTQVTKPYKSIQTDRNYMWWDGKNHSGKTMEEYYSDKKIVSRKRTRKN